MVHDLIRIPDDGRENRRTDQKPDDRTDPCRTSRIKQIFPHNPGFRITECLEYTDLRPLLLYHPVHGRHTHQRRYQEKEKRQYLRNSGDNRRIIFITDVTDICIPAKHIDIRLLNLVDLLLRICNLFLRICGLFIQCLQAVFIFFLTVSKLFLCIRQLLFLFVQLFFLRGKLLLCSRKLLFSGCKLCLAAFQLIALRIQNCLLCVELSQLLLKLCRAGGGTAGHAGFCARLASRALRSRNHRIQLCPRAVELRLPGFQLAASIYKLRASVIEFRLLLRKRLFCLLQLLLCVRDLLFAVGKLFLPVCQLLLRFFQIGARIRGLIPQLLLRIVHLLLRICFQAVVTVLRLLLCNRLCPGLELFDLCLINVAVNLVILIEPDKNFRIIIRIKSIRKHVYKAGNPPRSKRGRAALIVNIIGSVCHADDCIHVVCKQICRLFGIFIRNLNRFANIVFRKQAGIHDDFICRLRQPSLF